MGQPKLLLPFGDTTVIGRLISILKSANVTDICVLVRPDDEPLAEEVQCSGATAIQPTEPPAEMRVSVEHLLTAIRQKYSPTPHDGWLLIPGDHPLLTTHTLSALVTAWQSRPTAITLPTADGRRGHPTIFPWALAARVAQLPIEVGVNHLLKDRMTEIQEVAVQDPTIHLDLDTPVDYQRALDILQD